MKYRVKFFLLYAKLSAAFVLLFLAAPAFAEGGCPPGQYPIGGQGVMGCAPIPQAPQAMGGGQSSPVVTGKWHKTWGAIVVDGETGVVAPSLGFFSKEDAVSAAKKNCRIGGGVKCDSILPFENQCAALAWSDGGSSSMVGAENKKMAEADALARCKKYGRCVITFSDCTMPVFESY